MKLFTSLALLALLVFGLGLPGCSNDESSKNPVDKEQEETLELNDWENGRQLDLTLENLVGTWLLAEVYPNKGEEEVFNLTYVFDDDGSGHYVKGDQEGDFEWSLEEGILEFTLEEKSWENAASIHEANLYLVEKRCYEKSDDKKDNDKEHNDKDFGDKGKEKWAVTKLKFIREQ
ncbi:MAG: hypothetical protein P9L92_10325 [Candidatus Electryonea clarkiae]|nr:hypothetical protein [Candidatus Electryonea clarkiae]MDP8286929.1 hypothetical protein [Candidatus Electryonea clarkiae]